MTPSITWQGKEITNPFLRALALSLLLTLTMIMVIVALALWPIWYPIDKVLKHYGRRGFIIPGEGDKFSIELTPKAFNRVDG